MDLELNLFIYCQNVSTLLSNILDILRCNRKVTSELQSGGFVFASLPHRVDSLLYLGKLEHVTCPSFAAGPGRGSPVNQHHPNAPQPVEEEEVDG